MSSPYRHSLCDECWKARNGDREPFRLSVFEIVADAEICCQCNTVHTSGIYVRSGPDRFNCHGIHTEHTEVIQ